MTAFPDAPRRRSAIDLGVIAVMWRRELLRAGRDRSQLFGALSRTVLWLVILGFGLGATLREIEGYTYAQYILPGVVTLNVLFASLQSAIALVWGNLAPHEYHAFIEAPLWTGGPVGALHATPEGSERVMTLHYLINDLLMALFFALAGKEVWEATILQRGALRGRKAFAPLIATAGGMLGPVTV